MAGWASLDPDRRPPVPWTRMGGPRCLGPGSEAPGARVWTGAQSCVQTSVQACAQPCSPLSPKKKQRKKLRRKKIGGWLDVELDGAGARNSEFHAALHAGAVDMHGSTDMCIDMHADMCVDLCRHVCSHVYRYVYGHVYGHVYRHV